MTSLVDTRSGKGFREPFYKEIIKILKNIFNRKLVYWWISK